MSSRCSWGQPPQRIARALHRALTREKNLTYIALGPLTNLAALQNSYPQQARRIKRVILVGGQADAADLVLGPRGWPRIHDANIFKDPAAAQQVLRSGIPITLAPVAAVSRVRLGRDDWQRITSGPAGDYLRPRTRAWVQFWSSVSGAEGGPLFDVLPILAAARPDLVPHDSRYAGTDAAGNLLIGSTRSAGAVRVRVLQPPGPAARHLFLKRLAADR